MAAANRKEVTARVLDLMRQKNLFREKHRRRDEVDVQVTLPNLQEELDDMSGSESSSSSGGGSARRGFSSRRWCLVCDVAE